MTQDASAAEIRALIESYAEAVRAKDMNGVLANHAHDIVMFDVPKPLQSVGLDAYRNTWEIFFDYNKGGPGAFDVVELQVTAGESVAYCHAFVKIFESIVRITFGLRKEDGRWLIAHEHHSYPAELPSA